MPARPGAPARLRTGSSTSGQADPSAGGDGPRAGGEDVPGGVGVRDLGSQVGVQLAVAAVAVGRQRDATRGTLQPQHGGVAFAGPDDGVRHHLVIVLPVDPAVGGAVAPSERPLLLLRGAGNGASKRWSYRQYDHQVMTNTVTGPGDGDAAGSGIPELA